MGFSFCLALFRFILLLYYYHYSHHDYFIITFLFLLLLSLFLFIYLLIFNLFNFFLDYTDEEGNTHQVWFDNAVSNKKKVEWMKKIGRLRGVGVFTLDMIDYNNEKQKTEMWDSLNYFFS